jgi:hypothetical protein
LITNISFVMLGGNHTYKSGLSSTYKLWNKNFDISYGDGSYVKGLWANDTVNVSLFFFVC